MRDVNYPLRKQYKIALSGITYNTAAVPAFYGMLPDSIAPDNYIIFAGVTNNDDSDKTVAKTFTSMRVSIHTFSEKYNTGNAADAIAGEVLARIYAAPNSILDLTGDELQMVSTELTQDITQDYSNAGARVYLDRILIFRHRIFHADLATP